MDAPMMTASEQAITPRERVRARKVTRALKLKGALDDELRALRLRQCDELTRAAQLLPIGANLDVLRRRHQAEREAIAGQHWPAIERAVRDADGLRGE